jgi:hypothetical protein
MKRAVARAIRAMATATKTAMETAVRAMATVTIATATKRTRIEVGKRDGHSN